MTKRQVWLHPYVPPAKPKRLGSIDIETDGLGGDYLLGASYIEGAESVVYHPTPADMLDLVLAEECQDVIWYAHNGGRYDLKYLVDTDRFRELIGSGWESWIVCSGVANILGMRLLAPKPDKGRRRQVQIRDSYKLTGKGLDESCVALGVDGKMVGAVDFEGGEIFDRSNPLHLQYLSNDCRAVVRLVRSLSDTIRDKFGVDLGWTMPATAMKAFQKTLTRAYHRANVGAEEYARAAYFGGLVRPGQMATTDGTMYDRNSAYPSVMFDALPCGRGLPVTEEMPGVMGIYRVRANVPEGSEWTVLPYRDKGSTYFPTGEFTTYCTSMEIALARSLGHSVEVLDGYIWKYSEKVCAPLMAKCREFREQDYSGALGEIAKLMQNSLYGKFGSRTTHITHHLAMLGADGETCASAPDASLLIWEGEQASDYGYIHPEWACWITASQRCALHRLAIMLGPENVAYTDTDSMVLANGVKMPEQFSGSGYGDWGKEEAISSMIVLAPKTYAFVSADGSRHAKCKGIPRSALTYQDVYDASQRDAGGLNYADVRIEFLQQNGLLSMIKSGRPRAEPAHRSIANPDSAQGWRCDGSGRFWPRHIDSETELERFLRLADAEDTTNDKYQSGRVEALLAQLRGC